MPWPQDLTASSSQGSTAEDLCALPPGALCLPEETTTVTAFGGPILLVKLVTTPVTSTVQPKCLYQLQK